MVTLVLSWISFHLESQRLLRALHEHLLSSKVRLLVSVMRQESRLKELEEGVLGKHKGLKGLALTFV